MFLRGTQIHHDFSVTVTCCLGYHFSPILMRLNSIIVISGAALVGANDVCSLEDFQLIRDMDYTTLKACLIDQDADVWGSQCLTGVSEDCAYDIDSSNTYFIDDYCDYLDVPNSFNVCKAVALGASMADEAPSNSSQCNADDMAAIWGVNLTTVCLCANETISMAYTCTTQALEVTETCSTCLASREHHVNSVCGPICDQVDNDVACVACMNVQFAQSVGRCAQISSATGITAAFSGLAMLVLAVGLLAI